MTGESGPFDGYRDVVRPEWIDENGHLNMGYYVVVFDKATDAFLDHIGLTREFKDAHEVTTFSLENIRSRESAPASFLAY